MWPCGLMDKALVFGTKDCRFESCQGHVVAAQFSANHMPEAAARPTATTAIRRAATYKRTPRAPLAREATVGMGGGSAVALSPKSKNNVSRLPPVAGSTGTPSST